MQELGYTPPVYLHHGLLLGQDGAKLSKRSGSHSVAELRNDDLLPDALIQAMARLGHPNMPDNLRGAHALAQHFDAEHISTSSVRWSDEDMWRWHTRLLHELDTAQLIPLIRPYLPDAAGPRLGDYAGLIGQNIERAADAAHYIRLLDVQAGMSTEAVAEIRAAGDDFYRQATATWQDSHTHDWQTWSAAVRAATGCKGKALFMPLRVALSGALHGPAMSGIVQFLGRDGVTARLQDAQRLAES